MVPPHWWPNHLGCSPTTQQSPSLSRLVSLSLAPRDQLINFFEAGFLVANTPPDRDHTVQYRLMPTPIDWTRPWYASIQVASEKVTGRSDWRAVLNQQCTEKSLTNHRGLPVAFVGQAALPEGTAYEAFISATGNVPTRNNLHDFFNALVWLSFPNIKRRLNALQAAQLASAGVGKSRGPARDAATLFDENAAFLVVSDTLQGDVLVEALRAHEWRSAFLDQRSAFNRYAEVWLFGHALMEKLTAPYKAITAHAWIVTVPSDFFLMTHSARREWLDIHVANDLAATGLNGLSTTCFTPLPVLGVPGWWHSQDENFYNDAAVFRPSKGGQRQFVPNLTDVRSGS
jgi:Protein of unknown function (DUF3025)